MQEEPRRLETCSVLHCRARRRNKCCLPAAANNLLVIDADIAELYGVETKRINKAVKNNPDKFPDGYLFELNKKEWNSLKSKFSTSIKGGKVKLPTAFTEKGLYMLATILKSQKGNRNNASNY